MQNLQTSSQKLLTRYVERLENLAEQRKGLAEDMADIMKDAKGKGFDARIIRKVLAIRKMGKAEFDEQEAALASYLEAVSWHTTPLGKQDDPVLEAVNA